MRRLTIALVLMLAVAPVLGGGLPQRPGFIVIDTAYGFDTLFRRLEAAIAANQMGLVNVASASEGARAQGLVIPGNRVVGVFRNDFARRMLAASLAAGIEAPIRFYLVENPDRTATLSYHPPSVVFAPYFDEGGDALRTLAGELDAIFAKIATDATRAE